MAQTATRVLTSGHRDEAAQNSPMPQLVLSAADNHQSAWRRGGHVATLRVGSALSPNCRAGRMPMPTLALLRHAKSAYPAGVADHDRPLNARGRRDAPVAGRLLAQFLPTVERH